jgi:hypothetical protein
MTVEYIRYRIAEDHQAAFLADYERAAQVPVLPSAQPPGGLTVVVGTGGGVVVATVGVGRVPSVVPPGVSPGVVVSVEPPVVVDCPVVVGCSVVVSGAGVVVAVGSRAGADVEAGARLPVVPAVAVPVVAGRMLR